MPGGVRRWLRICRRRAWCWWFFGGSHDLGPYLGDGALYMRVTPRSYPDD